MKVVPVKGSSSLVRDPNSGAILNINTTEINQARERKALRNAKNQEVEELKNDVADLKNQMNNMMQLLTQLVERQ